MNLALSVKNVSISFGGLKAVDDVSFDAFKGEILSIIGPNGAGKTTLFNMISGIYKPDVGSVKLLGDEITNLAPFKLARLGLSRTFQNLQILPNQTVLENVAIGRSRWEETSLFADLFRLPSVVKQNNETEQKSMKALGYVGMADKRNLFAGSLPYGDLKRLEIARAIASEPDLLLLDEPAAGCNSVETEEINKIIRAFAKSKDGSTVILIEHDMKMVMNISHKILVLNQGKKLAYGAPKEISQNPEVVKAYLGTDEADL